MFPPAPGRLSMTTFQPVVAPTLAAISREITSVPPAGGKGTIRRIGRSGQFP
jgi:hypothetical protein